MAEESQLRIGVLRRMAAVHNQKWSKKAPVVTKSWKRAAWPEAMEKKLVRREKSSK